MTSMKYATGVLRGVRIEACAPGDCYREKDVYSFNELISCSLISFSTETERFKLPELIRQTF